MTESKTGAKWDHPKHYNNHPSGIECIDVIETMPFNVGSAIKYLWRAGLKPGESTLDDMNKAKWYVDREIARLSGDLPAIEYSSSKRGAP